MPEEQIADLIALLAPPPHSWVSAAVELPRARAALDELVARAETDDAAREAILSDLESALSAAGVDARPQLVRELRARLSSEAQ